MVQRQLGQNILNKDMMSSCQPSAVVLHTIINNMQVWNQGLKFHGCPSAEVLKTCSLEWPKWLRASSQLNKIHVIASRIAWI
uniref:Pectin acetylesterase n=1 Tax=Rhizophora mucronata TaxID=61149 RepID=A0A2P2K6Z8_RHIMU